MGSLAVPDNRWDRAYEVRDDQAFLMVQVMETWFLADPKTLGSFFGSKFATNAMRQWPDLESVPKAVVFKALGPRHRWMSHKVREGEDLVPTAGWDSTPTR